jgi:hypothetical protein
MLLAWIIILVTPWKVGSRTVCVFVGVLIVYLFNKIDFILIGVRKLREKSFYFSKKSEYLNCFRQTGAMFCSPTPQPDGLLLTGLCTGCHWSRYRADSVAFWRTARSAPTHPVPDRVAIHSWLSSVLAYSPVGTDTSGASPGRLDRAPVLPAAHWSIGMWTGQPDCVLNHLIPGPISPT